jgi:hypothetical protein
VSPPEADVEFLRYAGVLRISLSAAVIDTVVADLVVDLEIVERAFIVSQVDGSIFVDFHLGGPAFVRAQQSSGPAVVELEFVAGGDPYPVPAALAPDTVVIPPDPVASVYPLTITGYSMLDEDRLEGILRGGTGTPTIGQASLGARDHTWGAFSMVFPTGPTGEVDLEVADGPSLTLSLS